MAQNLDFCKLHKCRDKNESFCPNAYFFFDIRKFEFGTNNIIKFSSNIEDTWNYDSREFGSLGAKLWSFCLNKYRCKNGRFDQLCAFSLKFVSFYLAPVGILKLPTIIKDTDRYNSQKFSSIFLHRSDLTKLVTLISILTSFHVIWSSTSGTDRRTKRLFKTITITSIDWVNIILWVKNTQSIHKLGIKEPTEQWENN